MNRHTSAARHLRSNPTDAERKLWLGLRQRQIEGARFRRQQPIGRYIADFVCLEKRLVIEVDGGQHLESADDAKRDGWMRAEGYCVLHFWNNDVLQRTNDVLEAIRVAVEATPTQPSPLKGEGKPARRGGRVPSPLRGEGQDGGGF